MAEKDYTEGYTTFEEVMAATKQTSEVAFMRALRDFMTGRFLTNREVPDRFAKVKELLDARAEFIGIPMEGSTVAAGGYLHDTF